MQLLGVLGQHGLALTCLGSVWACCGVPRWPNAHLTLQLFATRLFPVNARLVYTFVQVLCSFAAIHWDSSYFSARATPAHIPNSECGQEQFYNLMEAKKGTVLWPAAERHPHLGLQTLVLLASPCCSHSSPIPGIIVYLDVGCLMWLGVCEWGWSVGEGAVYYLLPLDTNTRVPILSADVRLPGVQHQHLLKQLLGFYFHRKCS